ncbi:hypothetical protein ABEG18_25430 [Alsobacter sp. KACC 23698]|uniref:Uncharacterized protein n=1 Tax=Alsobacter sp. KACC 23698 TaxID=3149229 RepID=A0AAU7JFI0_9HYPH
MDDSSWTLESVHALKRLAEERAPASVIGLKLGREAHEVRAKLLQLGLSAGPDVESPEAGPERAADEPRMHNL